MARKTATAIQNTARLAMLGRRQDLSSRYSWTKPTTSRTAQRTSSHGLRAANTALAPAMPRAARNASGRQQASEPIALRIAATGAAKAFRFSSCARGWPLAFLVSFFGVSAMSLSPSTHIPHLMRSVAPKPNYAKRCLAASRAWLGQTPRPPGRQ